MRCLDDSFGVTRIFAFYKGTGEKYRILNFGVLVKKKKIYP
jgi:hypothetical protein